MRGFIVTAASCLALCACVSSQSDGSSFDDPSASRSQGVASEAAGDEWVRLALIEVNNGPLHGQKRRASANFVVDAPPAIGELRWNIITPGAANAIFSVALDVHRGTDETLLGNLQSGIVTAVHEGGKLYIRDVQNAPGPFTIEVLGHLP